LRAGLGLRTGLGTTSLGGTRSTLAFSTELILLKRRFSSCWGFAILSRRCHTSAGLFVKNKSGWATLKTRISSLTSPVSFTRGAEGYVGIRILGTEWVLLAASDIGWPVTGMGIFVIEKSANAELFGSSSIPASPITGARSFMAENTVQPIAVFSGEGRVTFRSVKAVNFVVVVTNTN